jgi:hypothetical protein
MNTLVVFLVVIAVSVILFSVTIVILAGLKVFPNRKNKVVVSELNDQVEKAYLNLQL